MNAGKSVLIVDDDPLHLRIYSWIVQSASYTPVPAIVHTDHVDLPVDAPDLVLLDYHLGGQFTSVETAHQLRERFPSVPILLLSDALVLPEDIAPHVQGFVRKGFPDKLVDALRRILETSA